MPLRDEVTLAVRSGTSLSEDIHEALTASSLGTELTHEQLDYVTDLAVKVAIEAYWNGYDHMVPPGS